MKPVTNENITLCAISMVRNEADIIMPFLNQVSSLFDKVVIVDIQSTDGTKEIIEEFALTWTNIEVFTCKTQERYQAAMMNELSRRAARGGADWIFFLDVDEFVNVEDKNALQKYLREFPHDVMDLPWINLVPSVYGRFDLFDSKQEFYWSGRVSPFSKVAVSSLYMSTNPEFNIFEGNHHVSNHLAEPPIKKNLGLTLLHVPVRSGERLRYKLQSALRLLRSKHNTLESEGSHTPKALRLIADDGGEPGILNVVAANYGVHDDDVDTLIPEELGWPTKTLPGYVVNSEPVSTAPRRLGETLLRDAALEWKKPSFVKESPIRAWVVGSEIRIISQPMSGDGSLVRNRYEALPPPNPNLPQELFGIKQLIEAVSASFLRPEVLSFSAWSNLVPFLFAMFSVLRPRVYAELGVHNGMSFFAACQVAKHLNLKTQCIAIDSWIGDPHASFHSTEVFDQYRTTLKKNYPEQHYIQGFFLDARECFADESIDLLHIDGYHTYEAVTEDFENWLPKMSQTGVIIFHDINVHERNFGVWRLWEDLKTRYPAFGVSHSHGLGVIYVGRQTSPISQILQILHKNAQYGTLAQLFFESLGSLAIEHRILIEEKNNLTDEHQALARDMEWAKAGFAAQMAEKAGLAAQIAERDQKLNELQSALRESEKFSLIAWQNNFDKCNPEWRRKEDYVTILDSGLFDSEYYLSEYEDVRNAKCDALSHFVSNGVKELRNPNKTFDMARYLLANADVSATGLNPFVHYILYGRNEGRAS